jgi:hypothetical protein
MAKPRPWRRIAAVAALFLLLCALSPDATGVEERPIVQYFPLAVGNRWMYELQDRADGAPPIAEAWEVVRVEQGAFVARITQSELQTGAFEEFYLPTTDGLLKAAAAFIRSGKIERR